MTRVEELPDGPPLVVANEFLDALPIRQFVRIGGGWSDGWWRPIPRITWSLSRVPRALWRAARFRRPGPLCARHDRGDLPGRPRLGGALGSRFARQPGAALFIDYGYFPTAPGPTLRALHRHRLVCALTAPGTADLSAHVDFSAFAEPAAAAGAEIYGPISQGRFLTALGAGLRLEALRARATAAQRQSLEGGVRRLLDPGEMGDLYKVVALVSPGLPSPAGFDPSVNTNEPAQQ